MRIPVSPGALPLGFAAGILLFSLFAPEAGRADEWTTYAYPNDMKDVAVSGGVVWIASSGGALSYDPADGTFRQYPRKAAGGPPSQDLVSVCNDPGTGHLFFGSSDQGMGELDPVRPRWQRFEFLPNNQINRVKCIGDVVYIGTKAGFSIRRSSINADICNEIDRGCCGDGPTCAFPSFDVRDFTLLNGYAWAATAGGPAEEDEDGWHRRIAGLIGNDARTIAAFDGTVFTAVPGARTVYRWNAAGQIWEQVGEDLRSDQSVGDLVRLSVVGSELYLCARYGLFRWNGSGWTVVPIANQDVDVRAIVSDGNGLRPSLYVAAKNGLYVGVDRGPGVEWTRHEAPGPPISIPGQAVAVAKDGALWIGTLGGVMSLIDGVWAAYRNGENGLALSEVFSLLADNRSRLWIGKCCCPTPEGCPTQTVDDGVISTELPSLNGWSMSEDAAGRIWIGSNTNGIYVLDASGNQILNLTAASSGGKLNSNSIKAIAAQGNNVWLGHEQRGLQLLKTGGNLENPSGFTFSVPTSGSSLPDGNVVDIDLEGSDAWVLTSGYLVRYRELIKFNQIALSEGGEPRTGRAVVVDKKGVKWVATNGGVLKVGRDLSVEVLNTSNSDLVSDDLTDAALDPKTGDILFASRIGTSRLRPGAGSNGGGSQAGLYLYPNPFRPDGTARVKVGGGSADNALVTDVAGRSVARFDPASGWDGRVAGGDASPGIYLIVVDGKEKLRLALIR